MRSYEVTVPFEALIYEGMASATTAELPEQFELPGGITVLRADEGLYIARVTVTARSITEAKTKGVETIREIPAVKKRGSVELERAALEWRREWPSWLPAVLRLNYLAVISHEVRVRSCFTGRRWRC